MNKNGNYHYNINNSLLKTMKILMTVGIIEPASMNILLNRNLISYIYLAISAAII